MPRGSERRGDETAATEFPYFLKTRSPQLRRKKRELSLANAADAHETLFPRSKLIVFSTPPG